ncbi:hypothetical protein [Eisenbergiella sp.]
MASQPIYQFYVELQDYTPQIWRRFQVLGNVTAVSNTGNIVFGLDLTTFDVDDMNFRLKKVPRIYADAYEFGLEPTKQSLNLLMRKYKK